jgi:hypothetical protein
MADSMMRELRRIAANRRLARLLAQRQQCEHPNKGQTRRGFPLDRC